MMCVNNNEQTSSHTSASEGGSIENDLVSQLAALSLQERLASVESIVGIAAGKREYLGELLILSGRLSRTQVEAILAGQEGSTAQFGDMLVQHGHINRQELDALLAFQTAQAGSRCDSPLTIGNLLLSTGRITCDELDAAVARQQHSRQRLGEVLINMGLVKPHDIAHGLKLQKRLLSAVLSALLCVSTVTASGAAHAGDAIVSLATGAIISKKAKASARANPQSLYKQGLAYQKGEGVEQCDETAMAYFKRAAEKGHIDAQYALGLLLQDEEQAMFWLAEAASRGHQQAQFAYNRLANFDFDIGC